MAFECDIRFSILIRGGGGEALNKIKHVPNVIAIIEHSV